MVRDSAPSNFLRAPRVAATPRCEIFDGLVWEKGLVQDISVGGLSLVCNRQFDPGQLLGLRLLPTAAAFIDCSIEVRYSTDLSTGAKILVMEEQYRRVYDHYLQGMLAKQTGAPNVVPGSNK